MTRAVFDPNIFISAAISPIGAPRHLLVAWGEAAFELIVSSALLEEIERALGYGRVRARVTEEEGHELVRMLRDKATVVPDPPSGESGLTPDPKDDYLIAPARAAGVDVLVSGDSDLTGPVDPKPPVLTPREFLEQLVEERSDPSPGDGR